MAATTKKKIKEKITDAGDGTSMRRRKVNEEEEEKEVEEEVKDNGQSITESEDKDGVAMAPSQTKTCEARTIKKLFGFDFQDIREKGIVKLMNEPRDPSLLGFTRVLFGLLMIFDTFFERGFFVADYRWGDMHECRFPLFDFLQPLPVDWMYVAYLAMLLGGVGMLLGLFYKVSVFMFVIVYWYIFLLDKTSWNNHSYLFGLIAFQMLLYSANHYWSLDGLRKPHIRNSHVPLWNYALLRFQIFLVYFIAGLKKLDMDWMAGYSMEHLSTHWVFRPFRYILTIKQISFYIVHLGGLTYDLSCGYLLFFDKTRPLGFLLSFMFHGMNSFMFSIGMFPFTMMATLFVFCYADTPRKLLKKLPTWMKYVLPKQDLPQPSIHCIYDNQDLDTTVNTQQEDDKYNKPTVRKPKEAKSRHNIMTTLVLIYAATQIFLPYSHFLTKGYNNWTNGLYGYSWDMMVHSWNTQHIKVTYVDGETGEMGFLNPGVWTTSRRWGSHGDMLKQYSTCIAQHLVDYNISDPQLYFDVWLSMNQRFQQRVWDPRVDLVKADWSPFKSVPFLLPLLVELSPWRSKLEEIEHSLDLDTDVVFVADFPGLFLENFVSEDLQNTSVQVLNGEVIVNIEVNNTNTTLSEGAKMQLPAGEYHTIFTVSDTPSCYMYVYVNTTEIEFAKKVEEYKKRNTTQDSDDNTTETSNVTDPDLEAKILHRLALIEEAEKRHNRTTLENVHTALNKRYQQIQRSIFRTGEALRNIIFGPGPIRAGVQLG